MEDACNCQDGIRVFIYFVNLLQNFFAELQDRQSEFSISDIQLGLTTLEEVFLNIARQAELEAAITEGRLVTLTLTSGASFDVSVNILSLYSLYYHTEIDNKYKNHERVMFSCLALLILYYNDSADTSGNKVYGDSRNRISTISKRVYGRSLLGSR